MLLLEEWLETEKALEQLLGLQPSWRRRFTHLWWTVKWDTFAGRVVLKAVGRWVCWQCGAGLDRSLHDHWCPAELEPPPLWA